MSESVITIPNTWKRLSIQNSQKPKQSSRSFQRIAKVPTSTYSDDQYNKYNQNKQKQFHKQIQKNNKQIAQQFMKEMQSNGISISMQSDTIKSVKQQHVLQNKRINDNQQIDNRQKQDMNVNNGQKQDNICKDEAKQYMNNVDEQKQKKIDEINEFQQSIVQRLKMGDSNSNYIQQTLRQQDEHSDYSIQLKRKAQMQILSSSNIKNKIIQSNRQQIKQLRSFINQIKFVFGILKNNLCDMLQQVEYQKKQIKMDCLLLPFDLAEVMKRVKINNNHQQFCISNQNSLSLDHINGHDSLCALQTKYKLKHKHIQQLQAQITQLKQENSELHEKIFNYEQKIIQTDLIIQERVIQIRNQLKLRYKHNTSMNEVNSYNHNESWQDNQQDFIAMQNKYSAEGKHYEQLKLIGNAFDKEYGHEHDHQNNCNHIINKYGQEFQIQNQREREKGKNDQFKQQLIKLQNNIRQKMKHVKKDQSKDKLQNMSLQSYKDNSYNNKIHNNKPNLTISLQNSEYNNYNYSHNSISNHHAQNSTFLNNYPVNSNNSTVIEQISMKYQGNNPAVNGNTNETNNSMHWNKDYQNKSHKSRSKSKQKQKQSKQNSKYMLRNRHGSQLTLVQLGNHSHPDTPKSTNISHLLSNVKNPTSYYNRNGYYKSALTVDKNNKMNGTKSASMLHRYYYHGSPINGNKNDIIISKGFKNYEIDHQNNEMQGIFDKVSAKIKDLSMNNMTRQKQKNARNGVKTKQQNNRSYQNKSITSQTKLKNDEKISKLGVKIDQLISQIKKQIKSTTTK